MSDENGGFDPEESFRDIIGAPSRKEIIQYQDDKKLEANKKRFNQFKQSKKQELFSDPTIDIITREMLAKELEMLSFTDMEREMKNMEGKLTEAKAGKGIYGINRKNAEMIRQMREKPGRQQTILTQGAKELSGTESTGILTGMNK